MSTFIRPVASGFISDDYDEHLDRKSKNPGTDYAVPRGTPVVAPAAGVVKHLRTTIGPKNSPAGRFVVIYFDGGKRSGDLLHLSRVDVKLGQRVKQGEQIGLSGGSAYGSETGVGNHVHLTIRNAQITTLANVRNIDPETLMGKADPWLDTKAVQRRLNVWLKHYDYPKPLLKVDGRYGDKTRDAIEWLQRKFRITVDRKVGPQTWGKISATPKPATPKPAPPAPTPPAPKPEPEPEPEPEPSAPIPDPEPVVEPETPELPDERDTPAPAEEKQEIILPPLNVPEQPDIILPAKVRSGLYLGNWIAGVLLAAVAAGYASAQVVPPVSVVIAFAVYGVISSAVSGLARANTVTPPKQ